MKDECTCDDEEAVGSCPVCGPTDEQMERANESAWDRIAEREHAQRCTEDNPEGR